MPRNVVELRSFPGGLVGRGVGRPLRRVRLSRFRFPTANRQPLPPLMGRAAIAMAAVRRIAYAEPGKITDHPEVRPPTAVMAITALPRGRLCRDAVPTLPLASHLSGSPVFPTANR